MELFCRQIGLIEYFFHRYGYGKVWPEIFGLDNPDSALNKECMKATCVWYQHPQNACPDNPTSEDPTVCSTVEECSQNWGCINYACNCNEWFYQVSMTLCSRNFQYVKLRLDFVEI